MMKGQEQLFSHKSDDWATPQDLFDKLNKEFNFTWDLAADETNTKCKNFLSKEKDADWSTLEGWLWLNPPYSMCKEFVKRAYEAMKKGSKIVMLLPVRTSNKWFHNFIYSEELWDTKDYGISIRFLKGRLKFGGSKNSAPFPSMLVIFDGDEYLSDINNPANDYEGENFN